MGRTVSVRSNRKTTDNGNVSRLNAVICWRTPSSRTRKSFASNLSIGAPVFLFFTSTSRITSCEDTRITGAAIRSEVATRCVFSCDKPNVVADAHKNKTALPTLNTVCLMHPSTQTGCQKLQIGQVSSRAPKHELPDVCGIASDTVDIEPQRSVDVADRQRNRFNRKRWRTHGHFSFRDAIMSALSLLRSRGKLVFDVWLRRRRSYRIRRAGTDVLLSPRGACYARRTDNRGSAGCIFRRGLRGDRDDHGPGAESTGSVGVLGSPASLAHGHQLCGELPVHRHYLDKPPLPYAVCRSPTLKLIWINFVHLFMVSLLPFATAWIARTRLASSPVAFYAG